MGSLSKKWMDVHNFLQFFLNASFFYGIINFISMKNLYSKLTVEGDKKTKWICGCFVTVDGFFKFCEKHDVALKRAIEAQIDELDLTISPEEKKIVE